MPESRNQALHFADGRASTVPARLGAYLASVDVDEARAYAGASVHPLQRKDHGMNGAPTSYSHPDDPVRHSYPLAVDQPGFSTAVGLMMRTMPYAIVRFGLLLAFSMATILWLLLTFGIGAWLASAVLPVAGLVWMAAGLGLYGWIWWTVVRYALYLVQAGHIAVLTELITKGQIANGTTGMFAYGRQVVTERFGEVTALFALDMLVRGVVHAFNRTLDWVARFIPIPGLQTVVGIVNAIVRAATTYIDETIFSYNLARGDDNVWRSSKDALIYYCQNSTEILKTAIWVVILDKVLTAALWVVMLAPAGLLMAVLPDSLRFGGMMAGFIVAALFASNARQAFLKPIFLVMIMTKFHVAVRNETINLEWDARLTNLSGKFRDITGKAAAGWTPGVPSIPGA